MIEFQLDTASGVATYLQLVQQVRQALTTRHPRARRPIADGPQQVVAKLAINPNTVLKATGTSNGRALCARVPARERSLSGRFLAATPRAGALPRVDGRLAAKGTCRRPRARRHRGDLPHRRSQHIRGGRGMSAVIETNDLGKQYGRTVGRPGLHLEHPCRQGRRARGPNGAGKTTLLSLAVGLLHPPAGRSRARGRPGDGPAQLEKVASSPRTRRPTPGFR